MGDGVEGLHVADVEMRAVQAVAALQRDELLELPEPEFLAIVDAIYPASLEVGEISNGARVRVFELARLELALVLGDLLHGQFQRAPHHVGHVEAIRNQLAIRAGFAAEIDFDAVRILDFLDRAFDLARHACLEPAVLALEFFRRPDLALARARIGEPLGLFRLDANGAQQHP